MTGYAQSGGTTVRGTVRDPNGNLVSGATVTLTDPDRSFTRTQSTNQDGAYVFNAIPPGTYKLDVTAQGFKTASASGLVAGRERSTDRGSEPEAAPIGHRANRPLHRTLQRTIECALGEPRHGHATLGVEHGYGSLGQAAGLALS
jgi:protocatechuate 3,4-dioxygenase beta subunit